LAELGAHFYFARRAPTTEEWSAVKPLVQSQFHAGEPVVIAPYWAEPMARFAFGDELMPIREVARPDVTRYAEALEVSILGQRAPELAGWKAAREERQGRFTVRTLQNPSPPQVTFDFTDHVDPTNSEVRIDRRAGSIDCAFSTTAPMESGGLGGPPVYPTSRFVCPGEPNHVFVGVTLIDDEKQHPRRCIWAHPPGADAELVTKFRGAPLGTKIHGHVGADWFNERDLGTPNFTIKVVVAGSEVGTVLHRAGDFWKPFELTLPQGTSDHADVEFRVSAPGAGTHVCFEADSR
jgi:hypothetical protein